MSLRKLQVIFPRTKKIDPQNHGKVEFGQDSDGGPHFLDATLKYEQPLAPVHLLRRQELKLMVMGA